jgi:hypothetical protein
VAEPYARRATLRLTAPLDGVYQLEAIGRASCSWYWLGIVPYEADTMTTSASRRVENGDEEPAVPLGSEPGRRVGLPGAPPPERHVYLPVALRNSTP